MITTEQLHKLIPTNTHVEEWQKVLVDMLPKYNINTTKRIAAFITQCAYESQDFNTLKENLNYRAESLMSTFKKYFPTIELANEYAHNKEAIANKVYANRMGNGDEASGDGYRYCGRGLLQITGKSNYQTFANWSQIDIVDIPEYLTTYVGAIHGACWFWDQRNCNLSADSRDIVGLTKKINGGINGLNERIIRYKYAVNIL